MGYDEGVLVSSQGVLVSSEQPGCVVNSEYIRSSQ